MDEVRHIYMMDNDKAAKEVGTPEGFQLPLPLHVNSYSARWTAGVPGCELRFDPEKAHARAGDTGYEVRLPDTCGLCKAAQLAEAATVAGSLPGSSTEAS